MPPRSKDPNSEIERQRRLVKGLAEDLEKLAGIAKKGVFPPGGDRVFEAISRSIRESGNITKLTAGLLGTKDALEDIEDLIIRVGKATKSGSSLPDIEKDTRSILRKAAATMEEAGSAEKATRNLGELAKGNKGLSLTFGENIAKVGALGLGFGVAGKAAEGFFASLG